MENKSKMVHIRLPRKLWVYYKKRTINEDKSLNTVILEVLENGKKLVKESVDIV